MDERLSSSACPAVLLVFAVLWPDCPGLLAEDPPADATWFLGLNTKEMLQEALNSSEPGFLCGEVAMGFDEENKNVIPVPIMVSSPGRRTSDLTLNRWLATVVKSWDGRKKVYLRLTGPDVLIPAIKVLRNKKRQMHFPLWLEASMTIGPAGISEELVEADQFFALTRILPRANLALAWTSSGNGTLDDLTRYSWNNVRSMANHIRCNINEMTNVNSDQDYDGDDETTVYNPGITFVANAHWTLPSLAEIRWLLEVFNNTSLTVTSPTPNALSQTQLLAIRSALPRRRVYFALPQQTPALAQLQASRQVGNSSLQQEVDTKQGLDFLFWPKRYLDHSPVSCLLSYYASTDTVLVNGGDTIFALIPQRFQVPAQISGVLVLEDLVCGGDSKAENSAGTFSLIAFQSSRLLSRLELTTTDKLWRLYPGSRKIEYTLRCEHSHTRLHFLLDVPGSGPGGCSYVQNLSQTNLSSEPPCLELKNYTDRYVVFGMMLEGWKVQVFHNVSVRGRSMVVDDHIDRDFPGAIVAIIFLVGLVTLYARQ